MTGNPSAGVPVIHSTPPQVPALISANPVFGGQPTWRASQVETEIELQDRL